MTRRPIMRDAILNSSDPQQYRVMARATLPGVLAAEVRERRMTLDEACICYARWVVPHGQRNSNVWGRVAPDTERLIRRTVKRLKKRYAR